MAKLQFGERIGREGVNLIETHRPRIVDGMAGREAAFVR